MNIPLGFVHLDLQSVHLAQSVEVVSSIARQEGKENNAIALFRLRREIREGLSYEKAKVIFDNQTKDIFS